MGPKKGKKETAEEPETPDQIEFKSLKTEADRLHKLTKTEEHDFNEFQQQRERLNYFWIVEKKKLEDKRSELRNKERQLQDLEEKHQVEIKIYKQRLKHLLYEHQNEITKKKTEAESALKLAQDDDYEGELDIKDDKRLLSNAIKEIETSHEEYVRGLKRELDQKITALRHDFERKANEITKMYDAIMKKSRDALDKERKDDIKAIEDRKHNIVEDLLAEHAKTFADIKNYYNDITHNNLDLIKSLKEEVKELEVDEKKDELRLQEKMAENKKLAAPLKRMQDDLVRLKLESDEYKKERDDMKRVKTSLAAIDGDQSIITWELETLVQRSEDLVKERDELRVNLQSSIYDVKQKSSFKGLLLEKKLFAMQRVHEEREAQLNEVLSRANLDPSVLGQIRTHVDDVMLRKNNEARKLQSEVARLQALNDQLQLSIDLKLREYGLKLTDLGFEPAEVQR